MREIRKVYFAQQRRYLRRHLSRVGGAFILAALLGTVLKFLDKDLSVEQKR